MSSTLLDTTYDIATPEGVDLRLPVAGLGARSLAWLIDALIKLVGIFFLSLALQFLGDTGTGLLLISLFSTMWLYNVLFEVLNNGATPGKKALGLRVMNVEGTPVGWAGSIIRNLIRAIDALPGVYTFGLVSVLLSERMQRLGDLAAGTVVVFETRDLAHGSLATAKSAPVNIPLSPDEQKAIVSFGERAGILNQERSAELAEIVSPIFNGADANKLKAHAAWIVGRGNAS